MPKKAQNLKFKIAKKEPNNPKKPKPKGQKSQN